ncbi:hypothetical protein M406DRAFT_353885 [Cryphonectria parasitica EP155]|uniref:DUF7029 domain-containing protein n=1 Tax=Cryphonectria parasitica (strain ATCC 38755 / EP155) TaxID=660469 RepID=A0A9P4XSW9_CRYP1|nr:uncharacterized protein M406DRAFT_353885 [Cryphonectria parasitica EP155]KAF3760364.1 hypothetical protein M406DRAFT_353885 [Cryphonectria parasitica EP155]
MVSSKSNIAGVLLLSLLSTPVFSAPTVVSNGTLTNSSTSQPLASGTNLPLRPVPNSNNGVQTAGRNVVPKKNLSLAWQTPSNDSAVSVGLTMQNSAVVLEDIDDVSAVDCTGQSSVAVTFNNTEAYTEALSEWSAMNSSFVMITNHLGDCDSELERSFFVTDADALTAFESNLTIIALAEKSDIVGTTSTTEIDFTSGSKSLDKRGISWNDDGLTIAYTYSIPSEQTIVDTDYVTVVVNEASINNSVQYSGHAKWELFKGVTEFYIDIDKSVYHYADMELTIKDSWSDSWTWSPDALSYSVLDVPGIISLGPSAGISFGASVTAAAAGTVTGEFTSQMPNGTIHMDFKDWDSSYSSGWETEHDATFNVTEDVSITLKPYIDFTVEFACKLFDGLIDLSTGVKAEPSFPFVTTATATQAINATSGSVTYPNTTSSTACANGLSEAISFEFDVTAFATEWIDISLYEYEVSIWDGCLDW